MTSLRIGRKLVTLASLLAAVSLSLSVSLLVAAPRSASADEKQVCAAASEKAQQLRSAGTLGEAREQLHPGVHAFVLDTARRCLRGSAPVLRL
jgi:hypothetical protein